MAWQFVAKKNASIDDTLAYLINAINVDSKSAFVKTMVAKLRSISPDNYSFVKNLFDFVCRNVKYKLDEQGTERIFTAQRTVRDGMQGADCKKMAGLIAAVLQAAGIDCALKHIYYYDFIKHTWKDYTHIYVIVPFPDIQHYLTVDPTNDCQWNKEVQHEKSTLYFLNGKKMDLIVMGNSDKATKNWGFADHTAFTAGRIEDDLANITGTGSPLYAGAHQQVLENVLMDESTISGIGRKSKEERKANRKKVLEKFSKGVKKYGLAPARGAFLELVHLNFLQLATRLAKLWVKDPTAVQKIWVNFGGKPETLKASIIKGSKVQIQGIGFVLATAIATATPVFVAFVAALKKAGLGHKDDDKAVEGAEDAAAAHPDPAAPSSDSTPDEETQADKDAKQDANRPDATKSSSVTILAMGAMFNNFPLYISLPIIFYGCWHYRKHILSHFTFINKF